MLPSAQQLSCLNEASKWCAAANTGCRTLWLAMLSLAARPCTCTSSMFGGSCDLRGKAASDVMAAACTKLAVGKCRVTPFLDRHFVNIDAGICKTLEVLQMRDATLQFEAEGMSNSRHRRSVSRAWDAHLLIRGGSACSEAEFSASLDACCKCQLAITTNASHALGSHQADKS